MFCWKRKPKERAHDEEGEEDVIVEAPPTPSMAAQASMHDYIYSPKDFCDSVLQKKLIPEFYLTGLEPAEGSSLRKSQNGLRASQGGDPTADAQDIRKSQGEMRKSQDLRRSQGDGLRKSQSEPYATDGPSPPTPRSRFSTFFSETSYTNINYYEEFVHLFPHFAVVPTDGFRVELGGRVAPGQEQELFLQEQDAYNLAYQKIFLKNDHHNFVGGDDSNPFIISILVCDDVQGGCRTIVRTKMRDHHIIVPFQSSPMKMAHQALNLVKKHDNCVPPDTTKLVLTPIKGAFIVKDLANFEDKNYKSKHKMGILYVKPGQTTEEEMFANTDSSPEFLEFLDSLAERITLRGSTKFVGGLDTKNDMTGTESYHTSFESVEIMFHVSPLLPYAPDKPVQVERKKHIGNDVVCIVFMDSATPFKPNTITSKFIHVIIVIQFLERNSENRPVYRVSVASKPGVEPHHPILPTPPHFEGGEDFRKFMLTKAINAERAAMHAPSFHLTRTRMNGLATIVEKHMEEEEPKKGCFG